jgi:hypothetical protein
VRGCGLARLDDARVTFRERAEAASRRVEFGDRRPQPIRRGRLAGAGKMLDARPHDHAHDPFRGNASDAGVPRRAGCGATILEVTNAPSSPALQVRSASVADYSGTST